MGLSRGGCRDTRQSFADILMFEASRRHAFAFLFLSFSSEMNTYFGLVRGRNLDLSSLTFQVPELQEEVRINTAFWCQQTGRSHWHITHYHVPPFDLHLTYQLEKPCTHQLPALEWSRSHLSIPPKHTLLLTEAVMCQVPHRVISQHPTELGGTYHNCSICKIILFVFVSSLAWRLCSTVD